MTLSTVISGGVWVTRKLMLMAALATIGLVVGVSAVILPPAVPLGIVALSGLVLLWVLPDLQKVPYRFARIMFFPFMVSALSVPVYFAIIVPGLPWLSIRRLILFVFAAAVIITLSTSSAYRSKIVSVCRASPLLSFFIFGYYAVIVLSMLQSSRPGTSANTLMNDTLAVWIPLVAAILLITNERLLKIVFTVFICCLIFDYTMGAIEAHLQRPFLIYFLPPFMRAQMIAQNPMYAGMLIGGHRNGGYRAVSIYNVALSWGEMSAFMAPITAYFITEGRTKIAKAFGALGLCASFGSVVLAGSRGGYVGFIGGMIIFFLLWSIRHNRNRPQSLTGGTGLVLYSMASACVLGAVFFVGRIRTVVLGGSETQASNDVRRLQWHMAWPRINSRPLLGHGPGNAGDVVGYVNQAGLPTLDSYLINVLTDTGYIGMFFFAGMLLTSIYLCLRTFVFCNTRASAFLGSLGCALVSYTIYRTTLSQTENNTTIFIMLGCVIACFYFRAGELRGMNAPAEARRGGASA